MSETGAKARPRWLLWTFAALLAWGVWAVLSKPGPLATCSPPSRARRFPPSDSCRFSCRWRCRVARDCGSRRIGAWRSRSLAVRLPAWNIAYYAAIARGEKVAAVAFITAIAPLVTVLLAVFLLGVRTAFNSPGLGFRWSPSGCLTSRTSAGCYRPRCFTPCCRFYSGACPVFCKSSPRIICPARRRRSVDSGAFIPVGIFFALRHPWPAALAPRTWVFAIALGFFLAFGNFAVLAAYARGGQAAVIAPLRSLPDHQRAGRGAFPARTDRRA